MQIGAITCGQKGKKDNNESIEVKASRSKGGFDQLLRPGDAIGGVDPDQIKRLMIRRTIKEHFDKELMFAANKKPIKVLSLFFIDSVEHYRQYDEDGNAVKGKYARMFEEEYRKLAKSAEYQSLFKACSRPKKMNTGIWRPRRMKFTTAISPSTRKVDPWKPLIIIRQTAIMPSGRTT